MPFLSKNAQAALAGYMAYRTGCRIPPLKKVTCKAFPVSSFVDYQHQKIQSEHSQDPGNLTLQILHSENPFLRFNDKPFTFLDSCKGSFAHSVVKHRNLSFFHCVCWVRCFIQYVGSSYLCVYERMFSVMCCVLLCLLFLFLCLGKDRLTGCFQGALLSPAVQRLSSEEQLGVVLVATRDFGRFLLEVCQESAVLTSPSSEQVFSRLPTDPGSAKLFCPLESAGAESFMGIEIWPGFVFPQSSTCVASFWTAACLLFLSTPCSKDGWTVDVDMLPICRLFLEQILYDKKPCKQ